MAKVTDGGIGTGRVGRVGTLQFRNEKKRNALSDAMLGEMKLALSSFLEDRSIVAIVVFGEGDHFCAGADLSKKRESPGPLGSRASMARHHELLQLLVKGGKPIIAAVEGCAFGAGFSMAMACDFVVAARDSRFCSAFARIGVLADMGLLWNLPQRVGNSKAKELITLAIEVGGEEAHQLGIVNRLVNPGEAVSAAIEFASGFENVAPLSFAVAKAAFADGSTNSLEGVLRAEIDHNAMLRGTSDFKSAVNAFLSKEPAQFTGD